MPLFSGQYTVDAMPFATKTPKFLLGTVTQNSRPFAWPCFPSSVPKNRGSRGLLSKAAAEQHKKKIYLLSLESYFVIKTDSHTSNYLYAASCLDETVWEHFHTKRNFAVSGQRLRFKIFIKAAFSSAQRMTFYAIYEVK